MEGDGDRRTCILRLLVAGAQASAVRVATTDARRRRLLGHPLTVVRTELAGRRSRLPVCSWGNAFW